MTTDKRRIDACLKACEGISTQNLEDNVPVLELARRYNVVLRERDALRAAVRHEADCVEAAKAEIKALRSELVDLRNSMAFRTSLVGRTEAERDALRAKIEQMEQQEPVAFALYSGWAIKAAYRKEHEACEQRDRRQLTADLSGSLEAYRVVPLYALPGAQTQGEEK